MSEKKEKSCFVISPFGDPYDSYFSKIIKPALDDCFLYAVRGDSLFRPATIMDEIWQGIRDASLLIAELTGRNPNVFYELGLAHALSKPVVLISNSIDDVPFDLRSIRVIVYDKNEPDWGASLRENLAKSIKEILDSPSSSIPATFKIPIASNAPHEPEVLLRIQRLENHVERLLSPGSYEAEKASNEFADLDIKVGDSVMHQKFGNGVVLEIEGSDDYSRVKVDFEKSGLKWLVLKYSNLQLRKKNA